MNNTIFTLEKIKALVKPLAQKYQVQNIYLFGSYARGEARADSDLDFLVYGGENFKLTQNWINWLAIKANFKLTKIFSLAEELREISDKNVDMFEIHEINVGSNFYDTIMKERLLVA